MSHSGRTHICSLAWLLSCQLRVDKSDAKGSHLPLLLQLEKIRKKKPKIGCSIGKFPVFQLAIAQSWKSSQVTIASGLQTRHSPAVLTGSPYGSNSAPGLLCVLWALVWVWGLSTGSLWNVNQQEVLNKPWEDFAFVPNTRGSWHPGGSPGLSFFLWLGTELHLMFQVPG